MSPRYFSESSSQLADLILSSPYSQVASKHVFLLVLVSLFESIRSLSTNINQSSSRHHPFTSHSFNFFSPKSIQLSLALNNNNLCLSSKLAAKLNGVLVDGEMGFFDSRTGEVRVAVAKGGVNSRKVMGGAMRCVGAGRTGRDVLRELVEVLDVVEETEKDRSWRVASVLVRDMVGG